MTTEKQKETAEPLERISDIVHQKSRLTILAALNESGASDFKSLKQITALTDGNLSRHLEVLEKAGLVTISKGFVGKRPRTSVTLTHRGLRAFEDEVAIMKEFLKDVQEAQQKRTTLGNPEPGYSAG
ncbi:MAG: transcriptional regulator [Actinomycetota bacterium]|nr:transcriptional regulator [Actinomycetota bacterium]